MKFATIFTTGFLVATLTGCSAFQAKPEPAPVAVAASVPVVRFVEAPAPVVVEPTFVETTGGLIAIGTLLDKLNENGCTIGELIYREVKRGGHVKISCITTNDLALDMDL